MTPDDRDRYGRVAFAAYNGAVGGVTWDGKPIPGWNAITEKIREAWRVAACVAIDVADMDAALPSSDDNSCSS